jgi:sugar lactone lactonase YvrE
LLTNCEDEVIQPPPKPPGYQEDIPWPSLANSPWPMNHHDPQNTGRSHYIGPAEGSTEWNLDANYMQSGIALGPDNKIYFDKGNKLTSVNYSGVVDWQFDVPGFILTTPIVSSVGTIYFCAANKLYKLSSDGSLIWTFTTEGNIETMMTIGPDGVIYLVDRAAKLYAIKLSGELLWDYHYEDFNVSYSGLAFSPDGHTLYITGKSFAIIAFDIINKTIKWGYGNGPQYNSPMVDAQGNVYYLTSEKDNNPGVGSLNCVNTIGSLKWKVDISFPSNTGLFYSNSPTIDKNGNIYFAYDTLYSLDYSGTQRWKQYLNGYADCPLVCDANSNIYLGVMGYNNNGEQVAVLKYRDDGTKDWELVQDQNQVGGSPALTDKNRLVFPTWRSNKIFMIK